MTQELIDKIIHLANINSGSDNPDGCIRVLEEIEKYISAYAASIIYYKGSPVAHIQDDGSKTELEFAPTLHGIINPDAQRRICLFGHVDTVFPINSPFQNVIHSDNTLYGPGVSDMKGGIIIMLAAIEKFLDNETKLNIGLDILLNSDEEVGSLSSASYFISQAPKFEVALGYEPALPCGNFAGERKGGITFTILAKGIAAHAGRAFDQGRNAITALSRLSVFCDDLWRQYQGLSINVGTMIGGGPVNIVPDTAIMRVNMRSYAQQDLLDVMTQIEGKAKELSEAYQVSFEILERNRKRPKVDFPKQLELQEFIRDYCQKYGRPHEFLATGGMCDGNLFSGEGNPTVDTLGAIGGKIHTHDEFLTINALEDRINLSFELLRYLNGV